MSSEQEMNDDDICTL